MPPGYGVDLGAGPLRQVGEVEQLADSIDVKAEFARMTNEAQALDGGPSQVRRRSVRGGAEAIPLARNNG